MIKMQITITSKSYSPKDQYRIFHKEERSFPDMKAAKNWIKENYGKSKRSPMFIDTKDGVKKVGYVIGFRNDDISHFPVEKWLQQDWISFFDEKPIYLN